MKKLLRFSFITLSFLSIVLALAIVVLTQSMTQKTVATYFLEKHFDSVKIDDISIGVSGLELNDLKLKNEAIELKIDDLSIDWDGLSILKSGPSHIEKLSLNDLDVTIKDLKKFQAWVKQFEERRPSNKEQLPKEHQYATPIIPKLPIREYITIESINASTKLELEEHTIKLKLSGGNIGQNQKSTINAQIKYKNDDEGASLNEAELISIIELIEGENGILQKILLEGSLQAGDQDAQINYQGQIEPSKAGEYYQLLLTSTKNQDTAPILKLEGSLNIPNNQLKTKYQGYIAKDLLRDLTENQDLPNLDITYEGIADYQIAKKELHVMEFGDIHAKDLGKSFPELLQRQDIHLAQKIDIKIAPKMLDLRVIETALKDASGTTLLTCELGQPFKLHIKNKQIKFSQAEGDLLRIRSKNLSPEYISALFPEHSIHSDPLSIDLILSKSDALYLRSEGPVAINHLSVRTGNKNLINNLSFSIQPEASYTNNIITLNYKELSLQIDNQPIALATGAIEVTLKDLAAESYKLTGSISSKLNTILEQPYFSSLAIPPLEERIEASAEYHFNLKNEIFSVESLKLEALRAEAAPLDRPLLLAQTHYPLNIPLNNPVSGLYDNIHEGLIAEVELNDFPSSLLTTWLPNSDIDIRADQLSMATSLSRAQLNNDLGDITPSLKVEMSAPLKLTRIHLAQDGNKLLSDVNLSMDGACTLSHESISLRWRDLLLAQSSFTRIPLLTSNGQLATLHSEIKEASFELSTDLPQAMDLPLTPIDSKISSGVLNLQGSISPRGNHAFKLHADLSDLRLQGNAKTLDLVTLGIEGSIENQTITFNAPFTLKDIEGSSEVLAHGSIFLNEKTNRADINLEGSRIDLNSMVFLADVLQAHQEKTESPSSPMQLSKRSRDTISFWHGIEGSIKAKISQIDYNKHSISDFLAQAKATNKSLIIETLKGNLMKAPFSGHGKLAFKSKEDEPYSLNANFKIHDLDITELMVALGHTGQSPIEGRFAIKAKTIGSGENLPHLTERIQGSINIQGRNGALRTLAAANKKTQKLSQGIQLASALFGSQVKELDFASQVIDFFKEIPFYQFNISGKRDESLDIELSELLLEGPEVHLTGQGQVTYEHDTEILNQDLYIRSQMDAKGKAASMLNSLGLLSNQANKGGYYIGPQFAITGTPARPDYSELYDMLQRPRVPADKRPNTNPTPKKEEDTPEDEDLSEAVESLLNNLFGR